MRAVPFIAIVLISGAAAGTIHGLANLALVEPYLDLAIFDESWGMIESGQALDTPEFWAEQGAYRDWQKSGQVLAGAILGTSMGALFGIVFAYSRGALPGTHSVRKALVLAGIMWFTIYFVPFLKYPANPPGVGEAETVALRAILYVSFIAISGLGAAGFYQLYKRLPGAKRYAAIAGYAVFISAVFVAMPSNPDPAGPASELVDGFRIASVIGVSIFWVSVAVILGLLWERFRPHDAVRERYGSQNAS